MREGLSSLHECRITKSHRNGCQWSVDTGAHVPRGADTASERDVTGQLQVPTRSVVSQTHVAEPAEVPDTSITDHVASASSGDPELIQADDSGKRGRSDMERRRSHGAAAAGCFAGGRRG